MTAFTAEAVGTALLVLLGDGVVAGVVLSKSKAEKSGWIVITTGWGLAIVVAVYAAAEVAVQPAQPGVGQLLVALEDAEEVGPVQPATLQVVPGRELAEQVLTWTDRTRQEERA